MDQLKLIIMQFRRRSLPEENIFTALSLLKGSKGTPLFSENWISNRPINIDDYYHYVEKIGNKIESDVLAGVQYVNENDIIKSIGLAYINGRVVRSCEKINPSKAVYERKFLKSGIYIKPVTVNGWKIGCVACVDIFYPEISRIHAINNANIIYNPASIPLDGLNLWHSVLSTRASENIVFSVGVNNTRTAYPDGRITSGHSIAFNPHGDLILTSGDQDVALPIILDDKCFDYVERRWAFKEDLKNKYSKYYENLITSLMNKNHNVHTKLLSNDLQ